MSINSKHLPKFHPAHFVFLALLAAGIIAPAALEHALDATTQWFAEKLGWLVMLACSFFVAFAAYLAFGRFGKLTLGDEGEAPQFSTLSWLAMLFAAGMGTGLIFYGAAEPLLHFQNPPPSAGIISEEAEIARRSMAITFFHWGIHAWAIYAIAALTIAYFTFRLKLPMLPSACITPLLRPRFRASARRLIDTLAITGVVFGIVATLCQAMLQFSSGVQSELTLDMDMITLQLIILFALFICYTISASTGIGKGIKILSDINMSIAVLLMLFVLLAGPTVFILDSFVTAIGDYLDSFMTLSFNLRPFSDDTDWTGGWSITYFMWWVSWAPFVGVFVARISRGRSIREFLAGVILVPTVFSALWFASFGGSALSLEIFSANGFADGALAPEIIFRMLDYFPLDFVMPSVVLALLFVFLITSADSGSYVLAMFTTEGELSPPVWERLFWGTVIALVTAGAILTGRGTDFFRGIAVVGSIPYLFIMLWQCWALMKQLKRDGS
jgi:glycine betaine transporter